MGGGGERERKLTGIGVSLHGISSMGGDGVDGQYLLMTGGSDHGVDINLIDHVLLFVPPSCQYDHDL